MDFPFGAFALHEQSKEDLKSAIAQAISEETDIDIPLNEYFTEDEINDIIKELV